MHSENQSLSNFTAALASSAPAPGGGGAAALAGALAAALAEMVSNLTTGKKKYAQFEDDIQRILSDAALLRGELLSCIDEDEAGFLPLAEAYGIPKDDPNREAVMEAALQSACEAPMKIMRLCADVIALHAELTEKGSTLMVSDVGVGVVLAKAALIAAGLNIRINVGMMRDRAPADELLAVLDAMEKTCCNAADRVYEKVLEKIT